MNIRADSKVRLSHHPDIHPDDARAAVKAWFARSLLERKKASHIILEKALIASAMAKGLPARGNSSGFKKRWKRARKDRRRQPIWDPIDIFILKNWRVMRVPGMDKCPGLIDWHPSSACELLRRLPFGENNSCEQTWYVKKRNRLGLKGKPRWHYRVGADNFKTLKDGTFSVRVEPRLSSTLIRVDDNNGTQTQTARTIGSKGQSKYRVD